MNLDKLDPSMKRILIEPLFAERGRYEIPDVLVAAALQQDSAGVEEVKPHRKHG